MRLASTAASVTTVVCTLSAAQAFSAPIKPAPERSARTHTVPTTTSTTVMGGGSPSTWPAARKVAPSLAGAYSSNMKTVFLALVRYSDWLASHPNPKLVKNYAITTSNIYGAQLYLMQQMVARGWHIWPQPTEIIFLKTVLDPVTKTLPNGQKYQGGIIETVINEQKSPYLNRVGKVVGHTEGGGPTAYVVSLVQDRLHTQFYIDLWQQVTPLGEGIAWEHHIEATR